MSGCGENGGHVLPLSPPTLLASLIGVGTSRSLLPSGFWRASGLPMEMASRRSHGRLFRASAFFIYALLTI